MKDFLISLIISIIVMPLLFGAFWVISLLEKHGQEGAAFLVGSVVVVLVFLVGIPKLIFLKNHSPNNKIVH